jgi:Fe2+ transport system protein FeoA
MIVDVEPVPGRPGRWNADCGAHHVHGVRTPLLAMARKLLEAGFDPEIELRMVHRGGGTVAMRVKIGDAAKLTVVDRASGSPRFAKYDPGPDLE